MSHIDITCWKNIKLTHDGQIRAKNNISSIQKISVIKNEKRPRKGFIFLLRKYVVKVECIKILSQKNYNIINNNVHLIILHSR